MIRKYVIPGPPVVQQRHRKGMYGNMYDPTKEEKIRMGWMMIEQGARPLSGPIGIEVVFYGAKKVGDLDNMIKALCDAGNGILWEDDRQVVAIEAQVIRGGNREQTVFVIKQLEEPRDER